MAARTQRSGDAIILYDDALLDHADAVLFTPPTAAASTPIVIGGRGSAWILERGGEQWVLRHYRRGGLPGRFIRDLYLWTGLEATRAWREWRLTDSLYKVGLPVPQPVAARVVREGVLYRADLITRRIPGARSLAEVLTTPTDIPWEAMGRCVRRFHDAGVRHADLNAHNILLAADGKVFLIDFDRGARVAPDVRWQQGNLARLQRSLCKLAGGNAPIAAGWARFLDAYAKAG